MANRRNSDCKQESFGSSRVNSNLLQQNCFVRDVTRKSEVTCDSSSTSSFFSLDEKLTKNGTEFFLTEYPYPITPQYVNSFVDSSDYRRDPISAINNGVNRRNLGDITGVQSLSSMDMTQARSLYEQLSKVFNTSNTTSDITLNSNSDINPNSNS